MRWESGDNDFYKDYLLDEVFDNCIRKLKKPGRVFGSVEAMNRYFTEHSEFMSYITNVDCGHGLVKIGGALVPFVNRVPKDTRLYELMTTKPGE